MNTNHPSREDLSAYALGALDPEETHSIEQHLLDCAECRTIVAEYETVAEGLLMAVPPLAPPPQLRERLAAQISNRNFPKAHPAALSTPMKKAFTFGRLFYALAIILLLAVNVYLAVTIRSLQKQQQALLEMIHTNQASLALVSQPGIRTIDVSGSQGSGSLVISPDGKNAVLFLQNLPELDAEHTYQAWMIPTSGAPLSAGLFEAQPGQPYVPVLMKSDQPLKNYAAIGVTVEPKGGSKAPSTKPIVLVNL